MGTKDILTAADICAIIKTCRRCEVTSFKLDGLEFTLKLRATTPNVSTGCGDTQNPLLAHSDDSGIGEESAPGMILSPADQEAIEEMETMQLLLDDPAAHEALMIEKNLFSHHREFMNVESEDSRPQ